MWRIARLRKPRPRRCAIAMESGMNFLQKQWTAVAILDVRGVDDRIEHQAESTGQDMTLAVFDPLGGIISLLADITHLFLPPRLSGQALSPLFENRIAASQGRSTRPITDPREVASLFNIPQPAFSNFIFTYMHQSGVVNSQWGQYFRPCRGTRSIGWLGSFSCLRSLSRALRRPTKLPSP